MESDQSNYEVTSFLFPNNCPLLIISGDLFNNKFIISHEKMNLKNWLNSCSFYLTTKNMSINKFKKTKTTILKRLSYSPGRIYPFYYIYYWANHINML